jgi:RNA recognition motif-containing protein
MLDVQKALDKHNTVFMNRKLFIKHFPRSNFDNLEQNNRFNNNNKKFRGPNNMNDRFNNQRGGYNNKRNNGNNFGFNGPQNGPMPPVVNFDGSNSPMMDNSGPDDFGPPGCIISMENVPYKASVEDIIEFFPGFNIQPCDVMRRYNDNGQPTGDARVCFKNPNDAQQAFKMRRNSSMLGRVVRLNVI